MPLNETDAGPATPVAERLPADALLEELSAWSPAERFRMFTAFRRESLSILHIIVLTLLEADGPLSMTRIADALDVSQASATGIVDRMEQRGLVERRHDPDDRRVVLIHSTEAAASLFRDQAARHRERLRHLLGELTDEEAAALLVGVRAMRAARAKLLSGLDQASRVGAG